MRGHAYAISPFDPNYFKMDLPMSSGKKCGFLLTVYVYHLLRYVSGYTCKNNVDYVRVGLHVSCQFLNEWSEGSVRSIIPTSE